MLKIRPEQFRVFQQVADAAFVKRVIKYLRDRAANTVVQLPTSTFNVVQIPDEILHQMVRNGIIRARSYGINQESSLNAFVVIMFVAAPNFDEHPLIQRVLRDENIPPDSRINKLWERISDQNWETVQKNYDVSAWKLNSQEQ